jgi:hypothetical protein
VTDRPTDGDVLITTNDGNHLVSVVPHPHRLSFGSLNHAVQLARKWAHTNGVAVWHATDGELVKVRLDDQN